MNQIIIYKAADGTVALISPNLSSGLTITQIADKDVPTGLPYKIVTEADIPLEPQELWDVDEADLTDGVGA